MITCSSRFFILSISLDIALVLSYSHCIYNEELNGVLFSWYLSVEIEDKLNI